MSDRRMLVDNSLVIASDKPATRPCEEAHGSFFGCWTLSGKGRPAGRNAPISIEAAERTASNNAE